MLKETISSLPAENAMSDPQGVWENLHDRIDLAKQEHEEDGDAKNVGL